MGPDTCTILGGRLSAPTMDVRGRNMIDARSAPKNRILTSNGWYG
jgi:hypothetical protein